MVNKKSLWIIKKPVEHSITLDMYTAACSCDFPESKQYSLKIKVFLIKYLHVSAFLSNSKQCLNFNRDEQVYLLSAIAHFLMMLCRIFSSTLAILIFFVAINQD